ncbi:MAG: serine hydrolase domain-containing protein [Balneolaceae bacterium]
MFIHLKEIKSSILYPILVGLIFVACSNNEYQEILEQGIENGYPGIIVGIQHDNKTWTGGEGLANIEEQIPMNAHDRFHIASVTKLFTSVAVLKLIDENKLSLQSSVDTLLANSLIGEIPNIHDIKVHHLLDHSSGIYSFNNDPRYFNTYFGSNTLEDTSWTPEQLVALAYTNEAEPQGKPGSEHYYSDTNTILLSLIIEQISGNSFRRHIKNSILDPLELNNTGYYSPTTNTSSIEVSPTVQGYLKESEIIKSLVDLSQNFERVSDSLYNTTEAVEQIDASAGMVSTVADLLKFGEAVYLDDFLSEESKNWLISIGNGIENDEPETVRQGIVTVHNKPYGVLYTSLGDGPGGINSMLAFHPKSDIIVFAFTNVFGNFNEHDFFLDELMPSVISNTK